MNRAIFLDKDGTIIKDIPYNIRPERVMLLPYTGEGLKLLQRNGYKLIIISNQSGIAKGFFPEEALTRVIERLQYLLEEYDVLLSGFYYCPHHPAGTVTKYTTLCSCRKPEADLIYKAAKDMQINLQESWFIGDILNDIEAGKKAGCKTVLIDSGNETEWRVTQQRTPDFIASDVLEAASLILNENETVPYMSERSNYK